jgi:hypothetical protein
VNEEEKSSAWCDGWGAYDNLVQTSECPYESRAQPVSRSQWLAGWSDHFNDTRLSRVKVQQPSSWLPIEQAPPEVGKKYILAHFMERKSEPEWVTLVLWSDKYGGRSCCSSLMPTHFMELPAR